MGFLVYNTNPAIEESFPKMVMDTFNTYENITLYGYPVDIDYSKTSYIKLWSEVKGLTLVPEIDFEQSGYAVVNSWNENERNLRLALAKARADKLGKTFDLQNKNLPAELIKTANAAVETENPLEAEIFLLSYRLGFLETLRPLNTFSEDYIFYYALKLKLIARIRQFDTNLGKTTYKDIYDSILDGDRLEA